VFRKRILSISLEIERSRLVILIYNRQNCHFNVFDNFAFCKTRDRLFSISLEMERILFQVFGITFGTSKFYMPQKCLFG
jgi:hypothetical protein